MWSYRRILNIPWTDRASNARAFQRMQKDKELLMTIKIRKSEYLDRVMRNNQRHGLLRLTLQ